MRRLSSAWSMPACAVAVVAIAATAQAGPPYMSDDPEPTDLGHFEIYAFSNGTSRRSGIGGESGVDINYGGAPDLQLTASLPIAYAAPTGGDGAAGFGNAELAAKYRFLHQADVGWDVAVFPRVFLPSASAQVGTQHAAFLLPLWLEKDWSQWSTFGGGGCTLNRGDGAQDFCTASWALVRQVLPKLQVGAEIVYQTADTRGGHALTSIGAGARYDFNETYHLLAYAGPGLDHADENDQYSWYVSILFTF